MNALPNSFNFFPAILGGELSFSEYDPSRIALENCNERIKQVAKELKAQISARENKTFECPVNLCIMKDPTVLNCGHVFDRTATEGPSTAPVITCPNCRDQITSRRGVPLLKDLIEEWLEEERIPTLNLFRKENKRLTESYFQIAKECESEEDFDQAMNAYTQAFLHTNKSEDYSILPQLYVKLGQKEKASLAYLYLASYQLQEDRVQEAIESLKLAKGMSSEPLKIDSLLVTLSLRKTNPSQEQINEALSIAAGQKDPEEAIAIYKHVIEVSPCQFEAYTALIPLITGVEERRCLFLMAAEYATREGKVELAELYLKESNPISISQQDWADPVEFLTKKPTMPQDLRNFLLGPCPIYPGKVAGDTHIVVPLTKYIIISVNGTSNINRRTLRTLDQLENNIKGIGLNWDSVLSSYEDRSSEVGLEWVAVLKGVFPRTRGLEFEAQRALVEDKGYQVPSFLDAATCILWANRYLGTSFFGDSLSPYIRCPEIEESYHLLVGISGFEKVLNVSLDYDLRESFGVMGFRKFKDCGF